MKKIVIGCIFLFLLSINAYALELDGIEVLGGFFRGDLKKKPNDYMGIPILVSFNYGGDDTFSRFEFESIGSLSLCLEPYSSIVFEPDPNAELGVNGLVKYRFLISDKFQPYFKGGIGLLYMTQKTYEQGTKFNFAPQAGVGFHFFLDSNTALTAEYRYRHISNNGIKKPNGGIDTDMFLVGVSFFYD